jgi:hypothetical protein
LIAELFGQRSGVVGGVGGSQHLHTRNFYTNGVQGESFPTQWGLPMPNCTNRAARSWSSFWEMAPWGKGWSTRCSTSLPSGLCPCSLCSKTTQYAQSTHRHDGNVPACLPSAHSRLGLP